MAVEGLGGGGQGIAFLVSSGIVFEIMAAACSSPQTTELNADKRAPTLMKWVNIGVGVSALFVIIASIVEPQNAKAIIAGGILAGGLQYGLYGYAKRSGLASTEPGTETY